MLRESADLRVEADLLHAFLGTLSDADWGRPTGFMGWTPWDVVGHLHYFDLVSLEALAGRDEFAVEQKKLLEGLAAGQGNAEIARRRFGARGGAPAGRSQRATPRHDRREDAAGRRRHALRGRPPAGFAASLIRVTQR